METFTVYARRPHGERIAPISSLLDSAMATRLADDYAERGFDVEVVAEDPSNPHESSTTIYEVHAHPRSGTRGVRAHVRSR